MNWLLLSRLWRFWRFDDIHIQIHRWREARVLCVVLWTVRAGPLVP